MTAKVSGHSRPPAKPMSPAPMMMTGNGSSRKKMPMNAAAAIATIGPFLKARLPIRKTASTTIASTAGASP
jgi:hypothetical protein